MGLVSTHTETNTHTTKLIPFKKTVHVHKAPTDDSIRLLNEFEEKVINNMIDKKYIENIVKLSRIVLKDDKFDKRVIYAYEINGNIIQSSFTIKIHDNVLDTYDEFVEKFGKDIISSLLSQIKNADLISSFRS